MSENEIKDLDDIPKPQNKSNNKKFLNVKPDIENNDEPGSKKKTGQDDFEKNDVLQHNKYKFQSEYDYTYGNTLEQLEDLARRGGEWNRTRMERLLEVDCEITDDIHRIKIVSEIIQINPVTKDDNNQNPVYKQLEIQLKIISEENKKLNSRMQDVINQNDKHNKKILESVAKKENTVSVLDKTIRGEFNRLDGIMDKQAPQRLNPKQRMQVVCLFSCFWGCVVYAILLIFLAVLHERLFSKSFELVCSIIVGSLVASMFTGSCFIDFKIVSMAPFPSTSMEMKPKNWTVPFYFLSYLLCFVLIVTIETV